MLVGEKGQVIIPKPIRDELGIRPGREVTFELRDGQLYLHKAEGGRGRAIVAGLRGRGDVLMSTDEILAFTRDA